MPVHRVEEPCDHTRLTWKSMSSADSSSFGKSKSSSRFSQPSQFLRAGPSWAYNCVTAERTSCSVQFVSLSRQISKQSCIRPESSSGAIARMAACAASTTYRPSACGNISAVFSKYCAQPNAPIKKSLNARAHHCYFAHSTPTWDFLHFACV